MIPCDALIRRSSPMQCFVPLRLPQRIIPLPFRNGSSSRRDTCSRCVHSSTEVEIRRESSQRSTSPPLTLYYSDHYEHPLPEKHRFPMEKYRQVRDLLTQRNENRYIFKAAPLAKRVDLELAHSGSYITRFLHGKQSIGEQRAAGFPWTLAGVRRALGSTGGTVAASEEAMQNRTICGHLAGGTHHAKRGRGGGFCIFNDLAVGALVAMRDFDVKRVALIDLDVHQGDGSAEIFHGHEKVFTASIHGENNYPFDKMQSDVDVGLPDGAGDELVLNTVRQVVPMVLERANPGFVGLQMGVDMLQEDGLGRLGMTRAGLRERNRTVYDYVLDMGVPAVITMGGGYSKPIDVSVQAHADVYEDAAEALRRRARDEVIG